MLPTYKQGRKIVWNGFTKDGRKFLDYFPKELIEDQNKTDMSVTFKYGSIYQVVGTDDVDSLVGTNPVGCVFSEYSLQDPGAWDLIRPILTENGGWALFIYTARGKNHGYRLLSQAMKNANWHSEVLVAGNEGTRRPDGAPVIPDKDIDEDRKSGMSEAFIQQEYFCSFEAPMVGSYYGEYLERAIKEGRILSIPVEERIPVDTYWDLGIGDSTTIWFIQTYGFEHRVVDFYESSGEGLAHYVKVLKQRGYMYGRHVAPWDIEVRELGTGRSRKDVARDMGIRFETVPQHRVEDGIEAVRNVLPTCFFDGTRCERGIDALKSYRKEYDEKNSTYKDRAVHDWSSHGADAFRTFAMGHRRRKKYKESPQDRVIDTHDYLGVDATMGGVMSDAL